MNVVKRLIKNLEKLIRTENQRTAPSPEIHFVCQGGTQKRSKFDSENQENVRRLLISFFTLGFSFLSMKRENIRDIAFFRLFFFYVMIYFHKI